jgi:hypothetical protein
LKQRKSEQLELNKSTVNLSFIGAPFQKKKTGARCAVEDERIERVVA